MSKPRNRLFRRLILVTAVALLASTQITLADEALEAGVASFNPADPTAAASHPDRARQARVVWHEAALAYIETLNYIYSHYNDYNNT